MSLFVLGARRVAFAYVEGAPIGRLEASPDHVVSSLGPAISDRVAATGLDPARFASEVRDALRVEAEARRTLEAVVERSAGDRGRALESMRGAAYDYAARARDRSDRERDLLERIGARIDALAHRFV